MANRKTTQLTLVTSLPDTARIYAVDQARAVGDQSVQIEKSDLLSGISGGGSQDFVATADQTDFTITANPTSLTMVFTGANLAKSTEFTYSGGILSFNVGRIVGTEIKVIY